MTTAIEQPTTAGTGAEVSVSSSLNANDLVQWPSLGGSSSLSKTKPTTASASATATATPPEDWEMITPSSSAAAVGVVDKSTNDGNSNNNSNNNTTVVTFEADAIFLSNQNPKCLKHCASSPNLGGHATIELASVTTEEKSAGVAISEDGSSVSSGSGLLVLDAPLVTSWSSTNKVSFRDAILMKQNDNNDPLKSDPSPPLTKNQQPHKHHHNHHYRSRKIKPKLIVVAPIKRCTKSTGDLKSLVEEEEDDVLGESDAMEYYSQKASGYSGRQKGLRTRPDEAKRRQIIINKKSMQRQQQASSSSRKPKS